MQSCAWSENACVKVSMYMISVQDMYINGNASTPES